MMAVDDPYLPFLAPQSAQLSTTAYRKQSSRLLVFSRIDCPIQTPIIKLATKVNLAKARDTKPRVLASSE
jgi:hypothetical protein